MIKLILNIKTVDFLPLIINYTIKSYQIEQKQIKENVNFKY